MAWPSLLAAPLIVFLVLVVGRNAEKARAGETHPPKGRWRIRLAVWLAIGLAVAVSPVACVVVLGLSVFRGKADSITRYEQLAAPHLSGRVGKRLALYAQSDPRLFPEYLSCESLLPKNAGYRYHVYVYSNTVDLMAGGGFHHYGYSLRLKDGAGDASTNAWRFMTVSDLRPRVDLPDVVLSKDERLSTGDAMGRVASNLNSHLLLTPSDEALHRRKVDFLVAFGEFDAARAACRRWIRACPESATARSALASVEQQVRGSGTDTESTTNAMRSSSATGSALPTRASPGASGSVGVGSD